MGLELKEVPYPGWIEKYNKLMKDPYLSKKYNRRKRIKAKRKFMGNCTPELKHCKAKVVLDIGCGMGEYLEICREKGHIGIGIDAKITDCEMGNEYIKMAQLMRDRQKLEIHYIGFDNYLDGKHFKPIEGVIDENYEVHVFPHIQENSIFYIVMQGSIEQCFKDYMEGVPHKVSKKASGLRWKVEKKTWDIFYKMFEEFERILCEGGYLVIWANGSKNNADYDNFILETAKKFPAFKLFKKKGKTFHKFRKLG
jgi:SAM-dependent methyltransferase